MLVKAKTLKNGLIKPIKKIPLPEGIELEIIINLPETTLKEKKPAKKGQGWGTLKAISEIHAKGGPKDLSTNIDKYLYGS